MLVTLGSVCSTYRSWLGWNQSLIICFHITILFEIFKIQCLVFHKVWTRGHKKIVYSCPLVIFLPTDPLFENDLPLSSLCSGTRRITRTCASTNPVSAALSRVPIKYFIVDEGYALQFRTCTSKIGMQSYAIPLICYYPCFRK